MPSQDTDRISNVVCLICKRFDINVNDNKTTEAVRINVKYLRQRHLETVCKINLVAKRLPNVTDTRKSLCQWHLYHCKRTDILTFFEFGSGQDKILEIEDGFRPLDSNTYEHDI